MTGFGSGNAEINGNSVYAEISTVNRKQLEIRFSLPRDFAAFEHELRKLVQDNLSRGMVSVRMCKSTSGGEKAGINRERVAALIAAARQLGNEFGIDGELSMAQILTLPGVFEDSAEEVSEDIKQTAIQALTRALEALNQMRATEGNALKVELESRLQLLEDLRNSLLPEVAGIENQLKQRLLDKLATADLPVDTQDERFLKEILYYVDKSDVTEELTRLDSHFKQFRNFLSGAPGGGRSMDFLIQEINREVNTIGSKSQSAEVAQDVVALKAEIERIREQIQNIE